MSAPGVLPTSAPRSVTAPPPEEAAETLARAHEVPRARRGTGVLSRPPALSRRVAAVEESFRGVERVVEEARGSRAARSAVAEWVLDNAHVLAEAARQVEENLPPAFLARLPVLLSGDGGENRAGTRRVEALANAFVESSDGPLETEALSRFLASYQRVRALSIGELWALPTFLRLSLLEDLARRADALRLIVPGDEAAAAIDAKDEVFARRDVLGLRAIAATDWREFFEANSGVDAVLAEDPAGAYSRMDFETRDLYRKEVEALADASGRDEEEVAREAVALCRAPDLSARERHVGFFLVDAGRDALARRLHARRPLRERPAAFARRHPGFTWFSSVGLLAAGGIAAATLYGHAVAGTLGAVVAGLVAVVPAVTVAVVLVQAAVTALLPPRRLPKMDFSDGIPSDRRTVVFVPALLTDAAEVRTLLEGLERDHVGNGDPCVSFALLLDFPDAPDRERPEDGPLLELAAAGVRDLNARHGTDSYRPFLLLHRERSWNEREHVWMGWERKRGKLSQANLLILGHDDSGLRVVGGDPARISGCRYAVTRDADTHFPPGTVERLVATISHPLNEPAFDGRGRVTAGYTVIGPRLEPLHAVGRRTPFARWFSGHAGLDLYSHAVSDAWQDLAGEGIYSGKGVYDVASFERSLSGRVPENALLSHDLFEGVHGRAGLASDVVALEEHPSNALAHARRLHRWVRGDWQLLPWLLPRVPSSGGPRVENRLSAISRWKIADNLRRSLVPPVLVLLLAVGWCAGGTSAWLASGIALGTLALPEVLAGLRARPAALGRLFANVTLLPHEAVVVTDAVLRTLWRLLVSRRRLLEWTTAAETAHEVGNHRGMGFVVASLAPALVVTAGVAAAIAGMAPSSLLVAGPFLLAWTLAPVLVWASGRPRRERPEALEDDRVRDLRLLARRTWHYFERFVGPSDHWLPPDNWQEDPGGVLGRRTSPTNVGLALLSTLTAHDMGFIGPLGLSARLRATFDTLATLERHRGHLLNWYDTHSLAPLLPRYVSTVDSGNLVACLWALAAGLDAVPGTPVARRQTREGFLDTLDVLAETVARVGPMDLAVEATDLLADLAAMRREAEAADTPASWAEAVATGFSGAFARGEARLVDLAESGASTLDAALLADLRAWSGRLKDRLDSARREIETLAPWLLLLRAPPPALVSADVPADRRRAFEAVREALPTTLALTDVPAACRAGRAALTALEARSSPATEEARTFLADLSRALLSAEEAATACLADFSSIAAEARRMADEADFGFLYDERRRLFRHGCDVTAGRLDPNHYDLLASEARLASFVAVAKGDVPARHWLHLGRPLARLEGAPCLLSWSGTMFEYLLPTVLAATPPGTLLDVSCRAAIDRQVAFGNEHGVPWGVSECAFAALDPQSHYRYRAFGVPGLGLKRGIGERLVVAPYASVLALPFRPRAAVENLDRLKALGLLGRYGLYEAADFGVPGSEIAAGTDPWIVRAYMVHHQAMILLALDNAIGGDRWLRRFHSDARVAAFSYLLDERVPAWAPREPTWRRDGAVAVVPRTTAVPVWTVPPDTPSPRAIVLGNGRLSSWATAAGGGGLRWKGFAVTRWRPDASAEAPATRVYVKDEDSGEILSIGVSPVPVEAGDAETVFAPHAVEWRRRERGVLAREEVVVAPGEDVEVRRVTVQDVSGAPRRLSVVLVAEMALAVPAEDLRHPAFTRLFVESAGEPDLAGLRFRRRPRATEDEPLHAMVAAVGLPTGARSVSFETDRRRFLGRRGSWAAPAALARRALSNDVVGGLDAIAGISVRVDLEASGEGTIVFATAAGHSREGVRALVRPYRSPHVVEAAFDRARRESARAMEDLGMEGDDLPAAERLLSAVVFPVAGLRAPSPFEADNPGAPGLWGHGISGDLPILLVRATRDGTLAPIASALKAHAFFRARGFRADLVILDEQPSGYAVEKRHAIEAEIGKAGGGDWMGRKGGVFLLARDAMRPVERHALESAAAVVLDDRRPIAAQLERMDERPARLPPFVPVPSSPPTTEPTPPLERPDDLLFDNGFGGFSPDGREYVIHLEAGRRTPAPWVNVVSNPDFGFLVSESGAGVTWAGNSGENRLTPWSNDPVADEPGEAIYVRDEETGQFWSPTPGPAEAATPVTVRHGAGYTTFSRRSHGLSQRLRLFVPTDAPVKVAVLRLENLWSRPRRVTATYYAEWVLGTTRAATSAHVVTEYADGALLARNPFSAAYGKRVAFLASSERPHGVTTDRGEFLGTGGIRRPAGIVRIGLSGSVGSRTDPCAALQVHVDLGPYEAKEILFCLGEGEDRAHALHLAARFKDAAVVEAAWRGAVAFWDDLLSTVRVETPDAEMDLLLNRWLLHSTLSCRLWARTGFYQSGGAFGFRDQLQDAMALATVAPAIARAHLLEAASRQFEEGDVLHWWHADTGAGVRTRCSDDLLWLPYAVAHYVRTTGDEGVLSETAPFLVGAPLSEGEADRYARFPAIGRPATLYEHCKRAVERGATRGTHGLPLIGTGDWNDGMNRVGAKGRGESVWLAWFLHSVLTRFAPLCEARGDADLAAEFRARADRLRTDVERHAWDGRWYLRAWYDDGTPLGSAVAREGKIDLIAQAWAVLSGAGNRSRAARAMASAADFLVEARERRILLLAPPFDRTERDPGYVKGYAPGVRENGGQYTHAAIWGAWAFAVLGDAERAVEWLRLLSPIGHARSAEDAAHYRVEPYVVAADVYAAGPWAGRGGWTWYTGAAGWMHRLGLERVLGVRRAGDRLTVDPCIPESWEGFRVVWRHGTATYRISVENPHRVARGVAQVTLDGRPLPSGTIPPASVPLASIPLKDDGLVHEVEVVLGEREFAA